MTKVLGLIPARGGSKGLTRKNTIQLLGKPLLVWSIESARRSALITDLYVSSEDPEIRDLAERHGSKTIARPYDIATDEATTASVALHALEHIGEDYEYIALIEPTSPLRKRNDIDNAINMAIETTLNVVSYGYVREHPWYMRTESMEPIFEPHRTYTRRQQLPPILYQYGTIYVRRVDELEKNQTFVPTYQTVPYIIEPWQCFEIDDEFDLWLVECIMKRKIMEVSES